MLGLFRIAERQLIKTPPCYWLAANYYSIMEITQKDACAVKKSWREVKDQGESIVVDTFSGIFSKYPDFANFFKRFGDCPEDILKNDCFVKDHGVGNVLRVFGSAVMKIDNTSELCDLLIPLGKKHIAYCMKPEHFQAVTPFIVAAIEKNSCQMDCAVKQAWYNTTKIIVGYLAKGLGEK